MQEERHKHYAKEILDFICADPDIMLMSPEAYKEFRLSLLMQKIPVLTLHKAAWDAGYRVNGFHPGKTWNLTSGLLAR